MGSAPQEHVAGLGEATKGCVDARIDRVLRASAEPLRQETLDGAIHGQRRLLFVEAVAFVSGEQQRNRQTACQPCLPNTHSMLSAHARIVRTVKQEQRPARIVEVLQRGCATHAIDGFRIVRVADEAIP